MEKAFVGEKPMNAFLYLKIVIRCRSPPVLTSFQMQLISEMEVRTMTDKEDKTVRQFVLRSNTVYGSGRMGNESKGKSCQ